MLAVKKQSVQHECWRFNDKTGGVRTRRRRDFWLVPLALFLAACGPSGEPDDQRGAVVVEDDPIEAIDASDFGTYHAIVIGIDDYHNWPSLKYAEGDAQDIYALLSEDYGFDPQNTIALFGDDATRSNILSALDRKAQALTENDNLLIYYAGHGQNEALTDSGYWVPVEGHLHDKSSWIRFSTITEYLESKNIAAKSMVVITDSCYGGALARSGPEADKPRPEDDPSRYFQALYAQAGSRSRRIIASGGFEEVPDRSEFADLLTRALERNELPIVDLDYLYFKDVFPTLKMRGDQEPAFARLNYGPGYEGHFVLVRDAKFVSALGGGDVPKDVVDDAVDQARADGDDDPPLTVSVLTVRSNVSGDTVFVDGRDKGRTRLDMDVVPGEHSIRVEKEGYETFEASLTIGVGESKTVNAQLTKITIAPPELKYFNADVGSIRPGESTELAWQTANASRVQLSGVGTVAANGTWRVTPAESTVYTLTAHNDDGQSVSRDLEIVVSARVPKVLSFDVKPSNPRLGDKVTISWSTSDAAVVRLLGKRHEPNGRTTIEATKSGTLVLEAISVDKEVAKASAQLDVIGPPKVSAFRATSSKITKGSKTRLAWKTENADKVVLRGVGEVLTQGYKDVSPDKTTTYELIAYGGDLQTKSTVQIAVTSGWVPVNPQLRVPTNVVSQSTVGKTDPDYRRFTEIAAKTTPLTMTLIPTVSASGDMVIAQTYTADLDTGKTGAGRASDLWFQAKTATARYLTPQNGAALAYYGVKAPGYAGCSKASLTTRSIAVTKLAKGSFVCVKTNQGRLSQLEVTGAAGASPGKLSTRYTTWK